MIRSMLFLCLVITLSACGRQVDIVDPNAVMPTTDGPPPSPGPGPGSDPAAENPAAENPAAENPAAEPGLLPVADSGLQVVTLSLPELLQNSPLLDSAFPVLVGPGDSVVAMDCCDSDGDWVAAIPLDEDNSWAGTIEWVVFQGDNGIIVLESSVSLSSSDSATEIDITPESYNRSLDSDGDGVDNLAEISLGTNPIDSADVSADFLSASVRIPRISFEDRPLIDGLSGEYQVDSTRFSGEWAAALGSDTEGNRLSIDNLMFSVVDNQADNENHHWLAMHDGTWLYLVVVIDDAGRHQSDSNDLSRPWQDDAIELFFDGDNSMRPNYDNVDDTQMTIKLLDNSSGDANSSTNAFPKVFAGENSVPLPAGLVFATGPQKGPLAPVGFSSSASGVRQDVYEIAIRLSDINVVVGRTFGMELQFDDDDNGGSRDAKWGWFHDAGNRPSNDFTGRDPRFMARVVLLP